jgi:Ca2+/Na+ antiporter
MRQIHLSQAGVANGSIVVIYMNSQSFQFTKQKTMEEKSFYRTPRLSVSDFAILALLLFPLSLDLMMFYYCCFFFFCCCFYTYTKRAQRCVSIDQCETSKITYTRNNELPQMEKAS